jgi:hypothetical protein
MHFVTDEFLASLQPGTATGTGGAGQSGGITDIWVEADAPRFDIEVISDLRVGGTESQSPGYSEAQMDSLRTEFVERFRHLRQAFKASRPADLIVNCGDLVVGRKDTTELEVNRVEAAYADICLPAFQQLKELDWASNGGREASQPPELLSIPGNEDAYCGGGPIRGPWASALPGQEAAGLDAYPYYSHFAKLLAANPMPEKKPESHPVASVFRVLPGNIAGAAGGRLENQPIACIVVVGFDSNDVQYKNDLVTDYGQIDEEQLQWSRRLISTLRAGAARSMPLYVIALTHHNLLPVEDRVVHPPRNADDERVVSFQRLISNGSTSFCDPLSRLCVTNHFLAENTLSTTSNASGFLNHCQQLRMSLVLHGNMYQRAVSTLTSTPLVAGQPAAELTVVAAPAFAAGRPTSGMARVSLDLWKGQAEVAFYYDTAPDGGPATSPIQIIRPLVSASRVSSAERRLYAKVSSLVAGALEKGTPGDRADVLRFADHVAAVWERDGYAPVSFPDGRLPHLGDPTRLSRYHLLLLLREVEGGNYEMLLSRHNALRPSEVAEWDTLLMAAFTSVTDLMDRLHLDVVRQVVTQAEDMERASSAQTFEAAVDRIRGGRGNIQDDIWLEKIRELATIRQVKISPTSGEITSYDYRLVVLTPFVRDPQSVNLSQVTDRRQREQLNDELAVVQWLSELPSVRLPGEPLSGRQTIPLEAIMSGGAGIRWEPAADPDGSGEADEDGSRRRSTFPPGAVWFPLRETDEREGPWTLAPSMLARNADVMRWVDKELAKRRSADGSFPPHIVLGQMRETTGYSLAGGPYPFAQASSDDSRAKLATSTLGAMNRVEYSDEFDLRGQRPYHGLDIRRVALARRTTRVRSGRERDVILVFDATALYERGGDLSSFRTSPAGPEDGLLGVLRPAQRYVLRAGLERAGWVNDFLAGKCADDPWGFLRARFGGAGEPLALTPPVIELVHWDDWDSDDDNLLEFVVCDGNHRIVRKVWNGGAVAAAIGVISPPRQPYYARPFSPYEWDITAGNVLSVTPDPRFRYAPRAVDLEKLELSEQARQELRTKPTELLYRRYYRDLSRGFGPIGGQGGRYV